MVSPTILLTRGYFTKVVTQDWKSTTAWARCLRKLLHSRRSCLYLPPFSPGVGLRGAPSEDNYCTIGGEGAPTPRGMTWGAGGAANGRAW